MLVSRDSAQDSCPPGLKHDYVSMDKDHADLPKFIDPRDSDYQLLKGHIEDMWRDAVVNVQSRFGSEGTQCWYTSFPRAAQTSDDVMIDFLCRPASQPLCEQPLGL